MIAQVETNTDCNRRCWYCPNAHYPLRPSAVMSLDLFEKVLAEISRAFSKEQLRTVSFAAYNEPTLDPYFTERLRSLTRKGFAYYFITNGSGITEPLVDFLISEKIRISTFHINLPAIDPEEYAKATGGRPDDVIVLRRNLAYLFQRWADVGVEMTIVVHGDEGTGHRRNYERMREFWQAAPVRVSRQPVMNRAGLLENVILPPIDHGTDRVLCRARHLDSLYIGVQANIYLCCHDYHQLSTYGNLQSTPLLEWLRSDARIKAIREFKKKFCRRCSYAVKLDDVLQAPSAGPCRR